MIIYCINNYVFIVEKWALLKKIIKKSNFYDEIYKNSLNSSQ